MSLGPYPETLQVSQSSSTQHGLILILQEENSILCSLTLSQPLAVKWERTGSDKRIEGLPLPLISMAWGRRVLLNAVYKSQSSSA